jgi:hypothetical protein
MSFEGIVEDVLDEGNIEVHWSNGGEKVELTRWSS